MAKPTYQNRVWRFQVDRIYGDVVAGMTTDRHRFAFWKWNAEWKQRFDGAETIYLRCIVGSGFDSPSVKVIEKATRQDW